RRRHWASTASRAARRADQYRSVARAVNARGPARSPPPRLTRSGRCGTSAVSRPIMKIAVAADHAGFPLKGIIVDDLRAAGHDVTDLGTNDPSVPCDYPDVAEWVCDAVLGKKAERGIILCGSGVGVGIVANKFPGIRAGVCHDTY